MGRDVDHLYRQHLTASDLRLMGTVVAAPEHRSRDLAEPVPLVVSAVLSRPDLEAVVFPGPVDGGPLFGASPFLTFAVAVHRTAERLQSTSFVEERWGSRQRVAIFDVESLRQLLAEPLRRYFLVELLASYTHVVSGVTWHRTRRGWRRRRFSELDMARMAELLEAVPPAERPGVYRRLGDLALFLTGVFPDHAAVVDGGPLSSARLARLARLAGVPAAGLGGLELSEMLGRRFYQLALRSARAQGAPPTAGLEAVGQIAERFREARRALNLVTDWYLFPFREHWFAMGS